MHPRIFASGVCLPSVFILLVAEDIGDSTLQNLFLCVLNANVLLSSPHKFFGEKVKLLQYLVYLQQTLFCSLNSLFLFKFLYELLLGTV